jgi:hypothetical protein
MARKVNPAWVRNRIEEVKTHKFVSVTTSYNPAVQWLVSYLEQEGIPCCVVGLGAGVKKIILAEKVCPHCEGKGYLK